MRQKRIAEILFATITIVAIVAIGARTATSERSEISHYENRYLATRPQRETATIADGTFFRDMDEYLGDHAAFRARLFQIATWADLHIIRRPNVNDVMVVDDLMLPRFPQTPPADAECLRERAKARANDLQRFQEIIEGYGGHFLYVVIPDQVAFFYDRFPRHAANQAGYRPERDAFVQALAKQNIPLLDMGEVFEGLGNPRRFYSGVDHHFSFYGAFATYEAIIDTLIAQTEKDIPRLQAEDFVFTELPNPYVGSRGRMLWGAAPFTERIMIAEPINPIAFRRTGKGGQEVPATVFELPETEEEEVFFTIYMGGDHAKTVIETDRPHLPNILVFGDSFTNAIESLIYLNFNRMTAIDLRHFHEVSLTELVYKLQPDIVIGIRDYSVLLYEDGNSRLFYAMPPGDPKSFQHPGHAAESCGQG